MSLRTGISLRTSRRHVWPALLTAAVSLATAACQSPFTREYSGSSDPYYESLVAHEIARGAYGTGSLNIGTLPTMVGTIREAGASTAASAPTTSALGPQTGPSLAKASMIGVRSATLRMNEPVVGLSLQDAIARAVQHSLAIRVESYNPAIKESLIHEAEANFDAIIFGNTQWSNSNEPLLSLSHSNGVNWTNTAGVKQLLPTGTQIQASTGFTLRDSAGEGSANSPPGQSYYTANFNVQLVQPLLRGFGADVNEATIYLAQRDLRISLSQFKQQVMTSVADVEEAYLNLVLARTNVEVLERLVVASEQTYEDVKAREKIDATKASINQALSALESRRADLHDAQKTYRAASDRLKTLLNDPELDIHSNILINPSDRPIAEPIAYEAIDCIQTALRQRPEMQQSRLQLERSDIILKVARNDLLPKLDLTLALQTNGYDRGFDQAYGSTFDHNIDETAALKFEMPLGNRAAQSAVDRRENERRQAITNMVQAAQQVVLDVKTQLREVYSNFDVIDYRDRVRKAAAEQFQGIIDLENIRPRTPEFLQLKLDSQANLAQSELQLTKVIIDYNLAIMRLERAKGTLLEYDRVSLDKAPPAKKNEVKDLLERSGKSILDP
jgi:outer membrane protein